MSENFPSNGGTFGTETHTINQLTVSASNVTYKGNRTVIIGTDSKTFDGAMCGVRVQGSNVTFDGFIFKGFRFHIDGNGGKGIKFNNCEFHDGGIECTSGFDGATITNNLFTGRPFSNGHMIYAEGLNQTTIANNEFIDVGGGAILSKINVGAKNVLIEQNYMLRLGRATGIELVNKPPHNDGTILIDGLTFQDNWYEHPILSANEPDNRNVLVYSLAMSMAKNARYQRNFIIAPEAPDGYGARMGFETMGIDCIVTDNYVEMHLSQNAIIFDEGAFPANVTIQHNRIVGPVAYVARSSFPAADRILTASDDGPNATLSATMLARLAGHLIPKRNVRYGAQPTVPPVSPPPPADPCADVKALLATANQTISVLQAKLDKAKGPAAQVVAALE